MPACAASSGQVVIAASTSSRICAPRPGTPYWAPTADRSSRVKPSSLPRTVIWCERAHCPPTAQITSYAGASAHTPSGRMRKARFLTQSSWLRAARLKTIRNPLDSSKHRYAVSNGAETPRLFCR
jgi:hypothetical protein